MKLSKILAGLLCVTCFLTMIPIMAVGNAITYDSIQDIVGNQLVPFKEFEFTDPNASNLYLGMDYTITGGLTFSDTEGLVLPTRYENNYWRYSPVGGWSSIGDERVVTFRAKPTDTGELLQVYILDPTSSSNMMYHFSVSKTGISTSCPYSSLDNSFVPGTGWVDFLVTKTSSGFCLYAKSETVTSDIYRLVLEGTGPSGSSSAYSGLYFGGYGAIYHAAIYSVGKTGIESVEELTGGAVTSLYDFQTKAGFATVDGMTTSGAVSYGKDGMILTEDAIWKFLPYRGWYSLSETTMVGFRAKIVESEKKITVRLSSKDGLARLTFSQTGVTASAGFVTSSTGVAPVQFAFPGSDWVDCLVVLNDSDGYSVYVKCDAVDGKWYLAAEAKDYSADPNKDMGIQISGSGMIQYVKQYTTANVVADTETLPPVDQIAYYQEEFVSMPTGQKNLTVNNGVVENGKLALTASADADGSYILNNGSIPNGGYAEFRILTGTVGEFVCSDGSTGISMAFQDTTDTVIGSFSKTLSIGDSGNNFRTWRILRNVDGSYSGYCRNDGDDAWYLAFDNLTGKAMNSNPKMEFIATTRNDESAGVVMLDYLKLCGPGKEEGLILTDGYGTKVVTKDSGYDYYDCLRALVRQKEDSSQILLFAEYLNGALVGWQREEIPAGHGTLSVSCKAKNSVSRIRAFLWDGLDAMIPGGVAQTAKLNWEVGDHVKDMNGGFTLDGEKGESYIALEGIVGETFDVEWSMTIQGYTGYESAELYTGSKKMVFSFAADGISCGSKSIPWQIGTTSHSYRVSGKNDVCYLYIDGEFVAELTEFSDSSESAKLLFRTGESL